MPPIPPIVPIFAVLGLVISVPARGESAAPSFNRDVRPILSENCFLCHSTDPEHRGGDLRLDLREEAIAAREGDAAIVPGKPEESALLRRILSTDPDVQMPPPEAHLAPLSAEQIETLRTWIAAGAEYEPHWAFAPPRKAELPEGFGSNPIDAFIGAELAARNIPAASEATPELLIRRAFLDLTGLPPSPAEVDEYLTDPSSLAWERLIERLMESPHHAEQMATPWLDAARYGDTHGFSIDDHRDMWGWRDWVIASYQNHKPYNEFLTEQLAGDMLPDATPDQIAATGFLRNGMNTHEGGIIPEEYRIAQVIDKVDAVGTAMLGLTLRCAQCHDHKFDPITQQEYFEFFAFFNQSSEPGVGGVNGNTPPVMEYHSPLGDGGRKSLETRLAQLDELRRAPSQELVEASDAWALRAEPSFPWEHCKSSAAKWIWVGQPQSDQQVEFGFDIPSIGKIEEAWIFTTCDDSAEIRLDGVEVGKVTVWMEPMISKLPGLLEAGPHRIEVTAANAGGAGGFLAIIMVRTADGWSTLPSDANWQSRITAEAAWQPAEVIGALGAAPWNDVTAPHRSAPGPGLERNRAFAKSGEPLAAAMNAMLASLDAEIKALQVDLDRNSTTVMVMDHHPELRQTHVLIRGAYDQPGEIVTPGTFSALPKMAGNPTSPTRLDLANWVTSRENPLTARVAVNRVWQMIFGRGIVESAGDFGNQGSFPSHPELLDWLAVDFMDHGWDNRRLLRTILTSRTYRQSAAISPLQLELDPRGIELSRSPRPRLAAETIRDQALAVSGLLDRSLGGPGMHPPQPDLWSEISHFGYIPAFTSQIFLPDAAASAPRRSIYTFWKRTSPPPAMVLFDAPTRETCSVVRGTTNTPLQALVLMNDPQFIAAGKALGHRMLAHGGDSPPERLAYGFRLATSRNPESAEMALLLAAYDRHLLRYAADPAAATALTGDPSPELASYAMIAGLLLNLDEVVTRP